MARKIVAPFEAPAHDLGMLGSIAILAAGYGTRLRPLTDELPKPLVPIGDRPLLAHLLERFRADLPSAKIGINASHLGSELAAYRKSSAIPFVLVEENRPLGTAGGIRGIREQLPKAPLLVWNGDILTGAPIAPLFGQHGPSDAATLFVVPREKGGGNVGLREDGSIVRLRKQSFGEEVSGGDFVGIHILEPEVEVPREGCIVGDVYLPLLARGARLAARPLGAPFVDVGTPKAYLRANLAWLDGRASWVHPSAEVSATVTRSIIGENAVVRASVIDTVVLPGATVERPLVRAIVSRKATIEGFDR